MQDLHPTRPTQKRLFFLDAFPQRGERGGTVLVPVTFNKQQVADRRLNKIKSGQLADAYRMHLIIGDGHPTEGEAERYPWWREYYLRMFQEPCAACHIPLLEGRAMSRVCHHQLCTAWACHVTDDADEGTLSKCTECGKSGRWLVFNVEQANDDRDHSDIILWM